MFHMYAGISESLESIPPDLTPEACKPKSPFLSFMWFKETFQWIFDIMGKLVNFFSTNMFEVIILLSLIGGVGIYRKEWSGATEGKVGTSVFQATNLSSVFKNLFAWLILINVLLIIFFSMFLYNKWKLLNNVSTSMKTDSSMLNQTSRSRMSSARGDNSAPVISKSKTDALKKKIEQGESKSEEKKGEEGEEKEEGGETGETGESDEKEKEEGDKEEGGEKEKEEGGEKEKEEGGEEEKEEGGEIDKDGEKEKSEEKSEE